MTSVTIARSPYGRRLAKSITVDNGVITDRRGSPQIKLYDFETRTIHSLDELHTTLVYAATEGAFIVRGVPINARGRRTIYDDHQGPANLREEPLEWCAVDLDKVPAAPGADVLGDPFPGIEAALGYLPPPFRNVDLVWQVTGSAGYTSSVYKLRLWFLLDYPCYGHELKTWFRPAIKQGLIDPAIYGAAQPHYCAVDVHGGADPCPARYGVLRRGREFVDVPDLEAMAERQRQRERASRTYVFNGAPSGDPGQLDNIIQDCITQVANASEGNRHPEYLSQSARVLALCRKYDLDWSRYKQQLMAAFESTLSASEIHSRRQSSTLGVMAWLEARGP